MIRRNITQNLIDALGDTPVVLLHGARQVGKSTLVKWVAENAQPARYVTLDDLAQRAAAQNDPAGFIAGFDGPIVIDEVQRAPRLFLPLKAAVDADRVPGRFLLTGSADVMLLPRFSEYLVGRVEILNLWPLSQGELEGRREGFIDMLFSEAPLPGAPVAPAKDLMDRVARGGYPEALRRGSPARRQAWFQSYVTTILEREVRELANIEGLADIPKLLSLMAARMCGLANLSELSRSSGTPLSTLRRYVGVLNRAFLVQFVPPWSGNFSKRLVRSPKMVFTDTGLAAHLLGTGEPALADDPGRAGPLVENFVIMELRKQADWSDVRPRLFHFRSAGGAEVDVVLEDPTGRVVGVEVKSTATLGARDFSGLKALADLAGTKFQRGIVLYGGTEVVPFGRALFAVPLPLLWQAAPVRL